MSSKEMTPAEQAIASGAAHVDQTESLEHGYSEPFTIDASEIDPANLPADEPAVKTELPNMTLSMFQQGSGVRVRVGNAHNAAELYERVFDSADEANEALLEAEILAADQIPDSTQLAGTGIALPGLTAEKLEAASLKRHSTTTL